MSEQTPPPRSTSAAEPDDAGIDVREILRERRQLPLRQRILGPDQYGFLLILIFVMMVVGGTVGDNRWGQLVSVLLLGATLAFTMKTSRASRRLSRFVLGGATVLLLGSVLASAAEFTRLHEFTSGVSFLLILAMIVAIARRLGTHMRIAWSMLAGALCAYLLLGLLFSSAYMFMSVAEGGSIFAQIQQATTVDTMYYSFITMTTVGYGDLTPVQDLPRMIAVTEALIGQIYLVTAVGLLVGNMGRERRAKNTPVD
ncbi:MAG: potassium channel family protein [Actinomycetota bacterium]